MVREKPVRIWSTTKFKGVLRELQANEPDKTMLDIQNDLADLVRKDLPTKKKYGSFWGKI